MSKDLTKSITWIVIATATLAAAVWQATHLAYEEIKAYAPASPPLRTRHAIRAVSSPWLFHPLTDYVGRCQKGLTEREIRWIIQDFKNAGLDLGIREVSPETCFALRKAQHRWYRSALVDGLRLSPEQSGQVTENLAMYLQQAETDLTQNPTAEAMAEFVSTKDWLGDDAPVLEPWTLCTLTPEQQTITQPSIRADASGYSLTAVRTPFATFQTFHFQKSTPPPQFISACRVFPFTRQQAFTSPPNPLDTRTDQSAETLVSQVRCLHPGQFKILLLFEPAMATQIQQALEITDLHAAR
jgi:hypothetical protein